MAPDSFVQSMQVEQYFFEDGTVDKGGGSGGLVDGFHVDIVLRDEYIQECKFVNV